MTPLPSEVRENLLQKGSFIGDPEAAKIGASLIAKATRILDDKRGPAWSEEKRSEALKGINKYSSDNDWTFLFNLMRHLLGKTCKLLRVLNVTDLGLGRDWLDAKDHLRGRCREQFPSDCIPPARTGTAWMDKHIEQLPPVELPRPHIAWGIDETAFTELQSMILFNQANELAGPGLYDLFCVVEARSMDYPQAAAENSCMGSGCAMVNKRRSLNQAACPPANEVSASAPGLDPSPKPDEDSFAFSIVVVPDQALVFVNWALVYAPDVVKWHMHRLRRYLLYQPDDIEQLHHDLDNILEWGVTSRKQEVIELCGRIKEQGIVVKRSSSEEVELTEYESS